MTTDSCGPHPQQLVLGGCDDEKHFQATLEPNPPLSPALARAIIGSTVALSVIIAIGFFMAGAWPVTGFVGLEIGAFVLAFVISRKRARMREFVIVDHEGIRVERLDHRGHQELFRLVGHWAKAYAEKGRGRRSCLVLRERGKKLSFGHFMNLEEINSLAGAINASLQRYRLQAG